MHARASMSGTEGDIKLVIGLSNAARTRPAPPRLAVESCGGLAAGHTRRPQEGRRVAATYIGRECALFSPSLLVLLLHGFSI